MKKVYFKGYYGYKNLGDDIFTVTAEWICKNLWKQHEPIFIGRNLPLLSTKTKKIEIKNELIRRLVEVMICIYAHNIIYFGGSLFSGGGTRFKDLKFHLKKHSFLYKKLGTIGTSIGPFNTLEDFSSTKELLSKFKFISVRDYSSIETLQKMNLDEKSSFCFDNAILLKNVFPDLERPKVKSNKLKIAVSLCHYERYKGKNLEVESAREQAVKNLLDGILSTQDNIEELVFIIFNGNNKTGDTQVTEEFNEYFSKKIKTRVINYSSNTKEMIQEINNCDFMLGVRLHSGIVAYALDIPFMLVEYHPKCTEFLNTINHNCRFNVNDELSNLKNYNCIIEQGSVPHLKDPNHFKDIMIRKLEDINRII